MVDAFGAHSTDMESPEDVHDICDKCKAVSEKLADTAEQIW
ncbi:hypothetical protein [Eubacterium aggregans]